MPHCISGGTYPGGSLTFNPCFLKKFYNLRRQIFVTGLPGGRGGNIHRMGFLLFAPNGIKGTLKPGFLSRRLAAGISGGNVCAFGWRG